MDRYSVLISGKVSNVKRFKSIKTGKWEMIITIEGKFLVRVPAKAYKKVSRKLREMKWMDADKPLEIIGKIY